MSVANLGLYYLAQSPVVPPPPPVGGYVLWYDASRILGQSDATALSSWTDLSGNGGTVTQTGSQRPTYYSSTGGKTVNGLPAVWFVASSNQLLSLASTPVGAELSAATLLAVLVGDGTSGAEGVLCNRVSGLTSSTNFSYYSNGNQWNGASYSGPAFSTPTSAYLLSATQDGSGLNVWENGTPAAGNPYFGAIGAATQHSLGLGSSLQAGESLNGAICEALLYPSVLGTTDRQAVEAYLRAKWATP